MCSDGSVSVCEWYKVFLYVELLQGTMSLSLSQCVQYVCELLAPFIPAAVRWYACALFWCTQTSWGGCVCKRSLTSRPSHARVHTLTLFHLLLYTCPPGGHPIPHASVCLLSRCSLHPDLLHMYMQRGTLFLSFTIVTRHVFTPSFPPRQPRAVCCVTAVWGTCLPQNRCPCPYTYGLFKILFILIASLVWMLLKT